MLLTRNEKTKIYKCIGLTVDKNIFSKQNLVYLICKSFSTNEIISAETYSIILSKQKYFFSETKIFYKFSFCVACQKHESALSAFYPHP